MTKKIESLTAAQKAKFPEYVDKWTRIGLNTSPANREKAVEGVIAVYKAAGLEAPRIVWCDSPISMALTRAIVLQSGDEIKKKIGASVRASVRASVWASVRASVGDSVWDSVGDSVWDSGYGQHDANWIGYYDYFRQELGLKSQTDKIEGLKQLTENAGWYLPHKDICWISERHCIVIQDENKRLHCETGPAVKYPDGWSIYAWHGVRIPSEWIENKETLSPQTAIKWENLEQRRVACEIIGWAKILKELKSKTINADSDPQIGTLVEVDLPDAGKERFLRVLCGTGREFALAVPKTMKTALEASAWTYNIDPKLYKPELRT